MIPKTMQYAEDSLNSFIKLNTSWSVSSDIVPNYGELHLKWVNVTLVTLSDICLFIYEENFFHVSFDLKQWITCKLRCSFSIAGQSFYITLTHLPLVPRICVSESGQQWFR